MSQLAVIFKCDVPGCRRLCTIGHEYSATFTEAHWERRGIWHHVCSIHRNITTERLAVLRRDERKET